MKKRGPKPKDRIGERFGSLVVIRRVPAEDAIKEGRKFDYFLCRCDCGNVAKMDRTHSRTSCGCKDKPRGRPGITNGEPNDLTGQRFGALTAIEVGPKPPNGQGLYWKCQCDCGTVKVVRAKDLRNGNTASCGCLKLTDRNRAGLPSLDISRPWRKAD